MRIGIIGKGKMGKDIFNHLFQYDYNLVWICRSLEDIDSLDASINKQLRKMLKRGFITEESYEIKKQSFIVSNELTALSDCDMVIETILENEEIKQSIFEQLESIVRPECILATNTSSIPLNKVFRKCSSKNRCIGVHFFYPVKVTRTVEINITKYSDEKVVNCVRDFLIAIDKRPLDLKDGANMILSNLLLTLITEINLVYEENYMTIEDIDKTLKENFVTFGLFEIIDSTGINIILRTLENFISERYSNLYMPFSIKGESLISNGYGGGAGNKGMYDFEKDNPLVLNALNEEQLLHYKQKIVLRMKSLLINEIAYLVKMAYVDKAVICEAVQEVLGLSENPISIMNEIGMDNIKKCLLDLYDTTKDNLYCPLDLAIINN